MAHPALRSQAENRHVRETLPARWPVFAAALLIAALFGLISGVIKDVRLPGGILSAEGSADIPHLTKREPLRAVLSADRKDGATTHWNGHDGGLQPRLVELPFHVEAANIVSTLPVSVHASPGARAFQPRAPPLRA